MKSLLSNPRNVTARRILAWGLPLGLVLLAGACSSSGSSSSSKTKRSASVEDEEGPTGDRAPSAKTLYSMSRILVSRGQDAEAEAVLVKLIEGHPEFMAAYLDLAELYLRNQRVDSAAGVLEAGIHVRPEDAVLLNNLGMCRLMQQRYEEALEAFTAATTGVPKDARSRGNMAVALGMLGRHEESLSLYKQILSPADAHYNLAVLCEARGDEDRAAQEFQTAEMIRSGKRQATPPKPAAPKASTEKKPEKK